MTRSTLLGTLVALLAGCTTQNAVMTPQSPAALTIVVAHALPSAQSAVVQLDEKTLGESAVRRGTATIRTSAPAGDDAFTVIAYDGLHGTGNVLAAGELRATLQPGIPTTLHVTLTGKPASIALSLENPLPPAGTPAVERVQIALLDADGNTIVGRYMNGVGLSDSDTSGATHLSATSISSSQERVQLAYSGGPLSQAIIAASTARAPRAHAAFAPVPTVVEQLPAPLVRGLPDGFGDLCIGPDGNVWITGTSAGSIEKVSSDGTFTSYPILGTDPVGISSGPDANLWFAEETVGAIAKITTSGRITEYRIPVQGSASSQPTWTAPGPDGRIWFVDQGLDVAGATTTDGRITEYPLPKKSFPQEIVAGPDGNLWVTDLGLNAIDVISTSGKIVAAHRLHTPGAYPWGITVGPDKNLWIAEYGVDAIGRMTPAGALREFVLPTSLGGPLNVTAGPDGNVWFAESGGGIGVAGKVGYITTDGSIVRDFPTPGNVFHVHNLVFNAAKSLWFTEFIVAESALGKFEY
jgi:streptogramin lyase